MKKIGIAVAVLIALSAAAVVTNGLNTDVGGIAVNHSQGEAVFPFYKLKTASSAKTIPFYTTTHIWPTTFVPTLPVFYDAGCQHFEMTETPATGTPSGLSSSLPVYCTLTVPLNIVDAGVFNVYKNTLDGGYGVRQCPVYSDGMAATAWPAVCHTQAGVSP